MRGVEGLLFLSVQREGLESPTLRLQQTRNCPACPPKLPSSSTLGGPQLPETSAHARRHMQPGGSPSRAWSWHSPEDPI